MRGSTPTERIMDTASARNEHPGTKSEDLNFEKGPVHRKTYVRRDLHILPDQMECC
jgi:hypothetical protein